MERLILTTGTSGAGNIKSAGFADFVITLERGLVWGLPPSQAQLDTYFTARAAQEEGLHWQYHTPEWRLVRSGGKDLGLIEFCARYDSVELWIDPEPNAQLNLIWLLDFLRAHAELAAKMKFVQADFTIGGLEPEELAAWPPPRVDLTKDHLKTASAAWHAYRAPTPQQWFNLLETDLSLLPQLRQTVVEVLEELPSKTTGLGATEMRMLELIAPGNIHPFDVFPGYEMQNELRVFEYWEIGPLLDGLARCPAPAVTGFDEGPFTFEMIDNRERRQRYQQSQLSLTALGKAILAGTEDFSRHNPIYRWWGGTELTNDRLWRWDAGNRALVAP
jgi:hypothetical protein